MSQNQRALFRIPSTADKLNLLQALLDLKDLTSELAFALIIIIRAELVQPQKQSAAVYRRYTEIIRCLCAQMPEVYEQVVREWQQKHQVTASVPNPPPSPVQGSEKATGAEELEQRQEKQPPEEI